MNHNSMPEKGGKGTNKRNNSRFSSTGFNDAIRVVNFGFEISKDASVKRILNSIDGEKYLLDFYKKCLLEAYGISLVYLDMSDISDSYDGLFPRDNSIHHNASRDIRVFHKGDIQSLVAQRNEDSNNLLRDPYLQHMFMRKMKLITEDGRSGYSALPGTGEKNYHSYITIGFQRFRMNLYKVSDNYKKYLNENRSDKLWKTTCPELMDLVGEAELGFYLHVENRNLKVEHGRISLPANMALIYELSPKIKTESDKVLEFSKVNSVNLYVQLNQVITVLIEQLKMKDFSNSFFTKEDSIKEVLYKYGEGKLDQYILSLVNDWFFMDSDKTADRNGNNLEDKEKYIDIYTFLSLYSWLISSLPARVILSKNFESKRSLNGKSFINTTREMANILFYESLSVNLGLSRYRVVLQELDQIFNFKLKNLFSSANTTQEILSSFLSPSNGITEQGEFHNVFCNNTDKYFKTDRENAIYYQNKRIWFGSIEEDITGQKIYLPSLKYDATWALILSDLLTSSVQTLLLYNNLIERHAKLSTEPKELMKITREAVQNSKYYYETGSTSTWFIDTYEVAKEEFRVNYYYDMLKEKLDLFSELEISQYESQQNVLIVIGGFVATLLLTTTMFFVIFQQSKSLIESVVFLSAYSVVILVTFVLVAKSQMIYLIKKTFKYFKEK